MPLNFPTSPAVNETYTFSGRTWIWDGSAWNSYNPGITEYVSKLNGFTGGITLAEGSNVTVSSANNIITISSTGVQSFNGLTGAVSGVTTSEANTFTELQTFNAGVHVNTISGTETLQVTIDNTLYTNVINPINSGNFRNPNNLRINNDYTDGNIRGDISIGDIDLQQNGTYIYLKDFSKTLNLINANSTINIGDVNNVGNSTQLIVDDTTNIVSVNGNLTTTGGATFGTVYASNIVNSFNGKTGAVSGVTQINAGSGISISGTTNPTITNTGVQSLNGSTGELTAVVSLNGLTGALSLLASTGVSISAGGKGITFTNTGVLSFNNITGAVTGVTAVNAGTGISISGTTNPTITNTGVQSFNGLTGAVTGVTQINAGSGILISGTTNPTITNTGVTGFNGLTGNVSGITAINAGTGISIIGTTNPTITNTGVQSLNGSTGALTDVASLNGLTGILSLLASTGISIAAGGKGITFTNTGVQSFNGSTGAVTGVTAVNPGTGISISGTTNPTITNTGVQSFNGLTGAVSGVTTSVANTFTALQTFNSGITTSGITLNGPIVASGLGTFNAGIIASGATFMGNINLQNGEFIRNTTDGRIDFMPAPAAANAYGLYVDATSWGFGTRLGTIRSSDNATNVAGILWDAALVTGNDVDFSFGSNQAYKIRTTATNNNYKTLQLGLPAGTVGYSSALAIMDYAQISSSLRQPNTVHTHPNLYIYSAGAANANDFIRLEHDRTNANIVTGQTSGILIQPGSGWLGVSGGISASGGITFSGNVAMTSTSSYAGLASFAGGISAAGATFSRTIALNGQTFTNVVSSVNGMSGSVGVVMGPVGFTSGSYTVFTFPTGVTSTGSKRPYYQSPFYAGRSTNQAAVVANRTYFILQSAPAGLSLTSLRFSGANTGITGNCHFSVWSVSPLTGLPDQRLYISTSTTVGSAYAFTSVTNASGLVRVPGGLFYIAASFSSNPTIYVHPNDRSPHMFGGTDYTSGYNNYLPVADTNGFTAPTSITQSGITFGFVDYYPTTNPIPILEWQGL